MKNRCMDSYAVYSMQSDEFFFQIKIKLINSKKEICQAGHTYTPTPQINVLATAQSVIVY